MNQHHGQRGCIGVKWPLQVPGSLVALLFVPSGQMVWKQVTPVNVAPVMVEPWRSAPGQEGTDQIGVRVGTGQPIRMLYGSGIGVV